MDAKEFREAGCEMVDYIADYMESVHERERVLPQVLPGYMKDLVPPQAPEKPQSWSDIMPDIDRVIMPGVNINIVHQYILACKRNHKDITMKLCRKVGIFLALWGVWN